jgi:hypothetical protein
MGYLVTSRATARVANRHQPTNKPINIRRGEGGGERKGGPLWSPAGWGGDGVSPTGEPGEQDAGYGSPGLLLGFPASVDAHWATARVALEAASSNERGKFAWMLKH